MKARQVGEVSLAALSIIGLSALLPATGAYAKDDPASEFIIGGVEVPAADPIASSTVAIISQNDQGTALCTGSLLDQDLVVTAGHCVGPSPSRMLVVFRRNLSAKTGAVVRVAAYIRDPNYGIGGGGDVDLDDIAVIRFTGGLPDGFQAAALLDDASQLQDGGAVTLAGFGITNGDPQPGQDDGAGVLREVDTTIAQAHYGNTEVSMDQSQGHGACHGDSGGPAFLHTADGSLRLFGVTSRGPSTGVDHCDSIGIYTNILAHLDFVQSASAALRAGQSD